MICIIINTFLTIEILKREKVLFEKKEIYILSLINALVLLISVIYGIRILNVLLIIWISYIALVDYKTCYVYDCMEYYGIIFVIIVINDLIKECHFYLVVYVLISILLLYLGEKAGCYGKGDTEVLAVLCLIYYNNPVYAAYVFMLSVCLFVIKHVKEILLNRGKLSENKPFIPSIYMANVIMTVYLIISSQSNIYVV